MTPAPDGGTDYDLEYWLRANVDLVNVAVRLTLGGVDGGSHPFRNLSEGQRIDFYVNGWMRDSPTSDTCRLGLDYVIAG